MFAGVDAICEESREAVPGCVKRGLEVVMLTSYARPVAEAAAQELGIAMVIAEVLPEQKAGKIKELQA